MAETTRIALPDMPLWQKLTKRTPLSFDLEPTARCNNDCRHCYINLPAGDQAARSRELSLAEIGQIADQALELGSLWCLLTGGEPLLRDDFYELYMLLKRKGLLISLFTNACLVTDEHIKLLKHYPPRDIEVTVYGVTQATYEHVTRRPGSYAAFRRGLDRLLDAGIPVRLKAMALRSNVQELPEIARFCRERTCDYFRFDPLLHLRFDGDERRNAEIRSERLSPEEIVTIEQADEERTRSLHKACEHLTQLHTEYVCDHLFHCGAGNGSFAVGYDGTFRLCSSLWAPGTTVNLRQVSLREAWEQFIPQVREMRSADREFTDKCRNCPLINLCLWCPAHAHLESGRMDAWCEYFCDVAHARARAIQA
ncbi:MAG: radical SAM protein [Anaerolineae bacterium]